MRLWFLLVLVLSISLPLNSRIHLQKRACSHKKHHETDISKIEPQYPSYITKNHFGLCLRASQDLEAGIVVGTNDCTQTDKEYIAGHESLEHRHSMVIGISADGKPIFGRVWGKGGYANHSCDPNCVSIEGEIITKRFVKKDEDLTTAYDLYVPGIAWDPKWNFKCYCLAQNCRLLIDSYKQN